MSKWSYLVSENPMMIEITRFRRKYFSPRGGSLNSVMLTLGVLVYLGIVAFVWNFREDANPLVLIMLQTGLLTLLPVAMLHGAIAGERERRSWDFLLVAPVTHAQIIAGKFMGAVMAILLVAGFMLLPIGIGLLFFRPYYYSYGGPPDLAGPNLGNLAEAELLSIAWAILVCAITIFFSARSRRGFVALGTTLGILLAGLIVWPILIGSAGGGMSMEMHFLNFFHPFWALYQMETFRYDSDQHSYNWMYGLPQIFIYLGLAFGLLIWAERTLRFADNDVKFLPNSKNARSKEST